MQATHDQRARAVAHALLDLASWAVHLSPRDFWTDAQSLAA